MSDHAIALPRSRRKRRKPPHPLLWMCLFAVTMLVAMIVTAVLKAGETPPPLTASIVLVGLVHLFVVPGWWYGLVAFLEEWKRENE